MGDEPAPASIDLFWLPLGAGGRVVRWNGLLYEWWAARREHRAPAALFHSALVLRLDDVTYAVEMGPVWNIRDGDRGVLVEGPVASRWLGRFRAFRYEMRCWPGGRISDLTEAVGGPVHMTEDPTRVAAMLDVLREIPALTWGRDELGAGEMWNSNSAVAWALARTGHDMGAIRPPSGGRAPGWHSGLVLADRQARRQDGPPGLRGLRSRDGRAAREWFSGVWIRAMGVPPRRRDRRGTSRGRRLGQSSSPSARRL